MNESQERRRVYNSRFLGALGFLGFLASHVFIGTRYGYLSNLAYLSLLSFASLLVFIPFPADKVQYPIEPQRKPFLIALLFLPLLFFLFTDAPGLAQASLFSLASLAAARWPEEPKKKNEGN